MRIVIVGASRFGATIAEKLIEADHEVVIIDKDRSKLEQLANRLDCGMLEGDGTMPTVLRDTWRDENDVFVAVTNASEDNILAALVARSIGFGRVIPQIVSSELIKVCTELDLTDVINPHDSVAQECTEALEDRTELDADTSLRHQLTLKRVHLPDRMEGCTLSDLDLPGDVRPVALIRDEDERLPDPDTALCAGDALLLVMSRDRLDEIGEQFHAD